MPRLFHWLKPKDHNRNLCSAGIHMLIITLVTMSMVYVSWFRISGNVCTPFIPLSQFFWFGYSQQTYESTEYDCFNSTIVNMFRILILLCFMAIIFSLGGFFVDILGPKGYIFRIVRKYAVTNICLVLWTMVIISTSYFIVVLLEDSLGTLYPKIDSTVSYGSGFYLIVIAGGLSLVSIFYTLILTHNPPNAFLNDERCLIDTAFDDDLDTFSSPSPPPPYNVPPPPYTP